MKRSLILALMCFCLQSLEGKEFSLNVEHANTKTSRMWGLMGRALEKGQGMLFSYPIKEKVSLWSFNCLSDLSVAFLDDQLNIFEIQTLKAHPEMMDPTRPVRSIKDFSLYPPGDPIYQFFYERRISSSQKVRYVLEVPYGWFEEQGISVGDHLAPF